jgi:hypothetical protein
VELSDLGAEQLAEALRAAELQLDDVLEERSFTLGQTGVHIGARELARMRAGWERDEARLRERIAAIKARLAAN